MGFKQGVDPVSVLPEYVQPEVGFQKLLQQINSIGIDGDTCTATAVRLSLQPT